MLLIELLPFTGGHGQTWYVKSSLDQSCPNTTACHSISDYVKNPMKYFTSNTTFIFMSGIHMLNLSSSFVISNASNLTLSGALDDIDDYDFPTLQCVQGTFGFTFMNSSSISIQTLKIKNCGSNKYSGGLSIINVKKVRLSKIVVTETRGTGVTLSGIADLLISGSTFSRNGLGVLNCPLESYLYKYLWLGVYITSGGYRQVNYTIIECNFIGNSPHDQVGGGLMINTFNTQSTSVSVRQCNFQDVISCRSSSASIAVNNFHHEAIIEVSDSHFSSNIRLDIHHNETHAELDGGALKINTHQSLNVSGQFEKFLNMITISNSSFYNNTALRCAGMAVLLTNVNVNGRVIVKDNVFLRNSARVRAGGACILPFGVHLKDKYNIHIIVSNSTFKHNKANDGAALVIWPQREASRSYYVKLFQCVFESNYAIQNAFYNNQHMGGTVTVRFHQSEYLKSSVSLNSCTFLNNMVGPSLYILASYQTIMRENNLIALITLRNVTVRSSKNMRDSIAFICFNKFILVKLSNIKIIGNEATGLSSLNCALEFNGHNLIANNSIPFGGGGLTINGTGYAYTSKDATVVFRNNTAAFGGALYSSASVSIKKQYLIREPCTFLGLNATFINNKAIIAGNDLYGGNMMYCTYYVYTSGKRRHSQLYKEPPTECSTLPYITLRQTNQSGISSNPFNVHICNVTDRSIYYTSPVHIKVFPGRAFKIPLITTGYCNGISPGVLRVSSSLGIQIIEEIQSGQTTSLCKEIKYTLKLLSPVITHGIMNISVAQSDFGEKLRVDLQILNCPSGMKVDKREGICKCEDILVKINGLHCNISNWPDPIFKPSVEKIWIAHNTRKNCTTVVPNCPFDYCNPNEYYFNLNNNADQQCNHNRTGTLCGSCQKGLSLMLGSNACSECSNLYIFILILFMLAGILLVVILIALNITVSVGSINGLLFYANIVKLNQPVFFPDGTIPVISHFISWLNLDFGFEVCFFNGLNGYWKTWLQFVFPLYIWLLAIIIIVSSHHSIRISRYLRSNIISVLATLVLISFTKILRNVTNALMMTKLHCGKNQEIVWSIDGSISYFSFRHALMIAFSVVVLVFTLMYSCFLFFSQWLQRYSNKCCCGLVSKLLFKLQPFVDAYTGPYIERYRYWTGLLLLIRLVLTFAFTYTSGSVDYINNYIIIFCELVLSLSALRRNIYRSSQIIYLYERGFHINICVLCLGNCIISQSSYKQYISLVTIVSVAVSMLLFILIVTQHILSQCSKYWKCTATVLEEQPLLAKCADQSYLVNKLDDKIVCRRESIIF